MNPFNDLLSAVQEEAPALPFIGLWTDKNGIPEFMRDANGKPVWFKTLVAAHKNFLDMKGYLPTKKFPNATAYAVRADNYMNHKLSIHAYVSQKLEINDTTVKVIKARPLNFHKSAEIGMIMPLQNMMENLFAKLQREGPAAINETAKLAKRYLIDESMPCSSCGLLCHAVHLREKYKDAKLEGLRMFCFECGTSAVCNSARYVLGTSALQSVDSAIKEIQAMNMLDSKFNHERATELLKEIMSCVTSNNLLMVNHNEVEAIKPKTKSEIPPWYN